MEFTMTSAKKSTVNANTKSFLTAILVIFLLMVLTYVLTLMIPSGEYSRVEDADGNLVIDTEGGFSYVEGGISFWKWLASPILVLGASGNAALIAVIVFLLVIGGVFSALDRCGVMKYMLDKMVHHFGGIRYRMMALIMLFFMALGSLIGSFEECIPLVPLVIALSINLGWDALTGLGMSLLAVGCGFAAGVCNPFTVGVAQQLAGLPMFSGVWLRMLSFVLIYGLLFGFVFLYAKKIAKPVEAVRSEEVFVSDPKMDRALVCFVSIIGVGIVTILCSSFIPAIQDYTMVIVAVMFLIAGISSSLLTGMSGKTLGGAFFLGVKEIFPAVIMILMASSIKYTLEEANVLDTIMHGAVGLAEVFPKWSIILIIYLIALLMDFFIASGSAKAFMLIPLIVPMAQIFGISTQLCIVAYAFGDGFSNVLYPTNAALLISLGVSGVSYHDWFKWSWKFHLLNLILTSGILLFGLAVGY